ncbi:MAG TPA: phage protein Gp36 family protein [Rhodopseudomonas sp.]|uniref:phage protein Gp36 family protein n=1 Tax=Rhodopseudomonas sp. TaxID=1078 RepID=UPI002ED9416A
MAAFATLTDVLARYPSEATILAADETSRVRDDSRIEAALDDGSAEVRAILAARYTRDELARIDDDSRAALRIYTTDIALYRVALSFGRSNERVKERYDVAIARLQAIAKGSAALTFDGPGGRGSGAAGEPAGAVSPNEAIVIANDRVLTRDRLRGW